MEDGEYPVPLNHKGAPRAATPMRVAAARSLSHDVISIFQDPGLRIRQMPCMQSLGIRMCSAVDDSHNSSLCTIICDLWAANSASSYD